MRRLTPERLAVGSIPTAWLPYTAAGSCRWGQGRESIPSGVHADAGCCCPVVGNGPVGRDLHVCRRPGQQVVPKRRQRQGLQASRCRAGAVAAGTAPACEPGWAAVVRGARVGLASIVHESIATRSAPATAIVVASEDELRVEEAPGRLVPSSTTAIELR
jgi:hypothetical protein